MKRISESGRSMVEMLGVLAIIGVLSVAGIAGYTTAMRSYRTNEIVNATAMLYMLAMSQNQGNGPTTDTTYASLNNGSNPSGVSSLTYNKNDKTITIVFNDPTDCSMAANKLGNKATANCESKSLTVNFGENTTVEPEPVVEEFDPVNNPSCNQVGEQKCYNNNLYECYPPNPGELWGLWGLLDENSSNCN